LPLLIDYLSQKAIQVEYVVVDDGSTDWIETKKYATELGATFLQNEKNQGKGAAVRKGMLHATGDLRIFTDVDIPFQLEAFDAFLEQFQNKSVDLVIGDRRLPESEYFSKISNNRKLGSKLFSFIVGASMGVGQYDTQCGMKGFTGEAAQRIFSVSKISSFAFDVEVLSIAKSKNMHIACVPVILRNQETSSVSLAKHAVGMLLDLIRIKWNLVSGKYKG
jgi:dolichyl-phosphate beta-glucosyltransferase